MSEAALERKRAVKQPLSLNKKIARFFKLYGWSYAFIFVALLLSSLIQGCSKFWRGFFLAAYYLPAVTSVVIIAMTWRWIYNSEFGLFNGQSPKELSLLASTRRRCFDILIFNPEKKASWEGLRTDRKETHGELFRAVSPR